MRNKATPSTLWPPLLPSSWLPLSAAQGSFGCCANKANTLSPLCIPLGLNWATIKLATKANSTLHFWHRRCSHKYSTCVCLPLSPSLSPSLSPLQIQIFGYNSQLYANFSDALNRAQGIVGVSILLQVSQLPLSLCMMLPSHSRICSAAGRSLQSGATHAHRSAGTNPLWRRRGLRQAPLNTRPDARHGSLHDLRRLHHSARLPWDRHLGSAQQAHLHYEATGEL